MVRYNGMGMSYILTPEASGKTIITQGENSIVVDHPIDDISQSWYNWQHQGLLLQHAFPYLDANQREFILTGLTESDWERIFPEGREDE